ncbi:unnamed protein product, partial [Phytomonas sp. EM1]
MVEDKFAPETISARCLGRQSRSGVSVAKLMRGERSEGEEKPTQQHGKSIKKKKFTNPSEFLAGPGQPGRITHGPRRFRGTNKDTVSKMLSDAFIMGESSAIVVEDKARCKQLSSKSYLTHLTNVCDVTEEPAPFRTQIHINPAARKTEVPFSLYNDVRPVPKQDKLGKRQYKNSVSMKNFLTGTDDNGNMFVPEQMKGSYRSSKSNKSVDVLNLGKYNPDALQEVRPPVIQRGPRHFEPPEMPPRRRPHIRPMKVVAKEEHDVLGTGLSGKPMEVKHSCKARGVAHPSESNNLFGGVFLTKEENGANGVGGGHGPTSGRRAANNGSPNLLRYYDPTLDGPAEPMQRPKHGNRSNMESNHDVPIPATGKGKGFFHDRYSRQSPGLLEYA